MKRAQATSRQGAKAQSAPVKPLRPPAAESELNEAARVWTAAQDVMVARGFGRILWGTQRHCCHEFVVLMLRASASPRETVPPARRALAPLRESSPDHVPL